MLMEFQDVRQLESWLAAKQIDTSQWGGVGTKSLANLWTEYIEGEISFQDDPPTRIVQVVQVIIRRGNRILLEVEQEFGNNQRRVRKQPPSEKLKRGESYVEAAQRCLEEELGLRSNEMAFLGAGGYQQVQVVNESPSYPGLTTRYTFHAVEAIVKGLPDCDFWLDNRSFNSGDPIRRHRWAWLAE
jgi:hypothetical protein